MCTGAIERETVCETERGVFAGLRVVVGGGVCVTDRQRSRVSEGER